MDKIKNKLISLMNNNVENLLILFIELIYLAGCYTLAFEKTINVFFSWKFLFLLTYTLTSFFFLNFDFVFKNSEEKRGTLEKILLGISYILTIFFIDFYYLKTGFILFNFVNIGALILGYLLQKYKHLIYIYMNEMGVITQRKTRENIKFLLYLPLSFIILSIIIFTLSSIDGYFKKTGYTTAYTNTIIDIVQLCQLMICVSIFFHCVYLFFNVSVNKIPELKQKKAKCARDYAENFLSNEIIANNLNFGLYITKHVLFILIQISLINSLPTMFTMFRDDVDYNSIADVMIPLMIYVSFYLFKYNKQVFKFSNITIFFTFFAICGGFIFSNNSNEWGEVNYVYNQTIPTYFQDKNEFKKSFVKIPSGTQRQMKSISSNKEGKIFYSVDNIWIDSKYFDLPNEYSIQFLDAEVMVNKRKSDKSIVSGLSLGKKYVVTNRKIESGKIFYKIKGASWIADHNLIIIKEIFRGDKNFY